MPDGRSRRGAQGSGHRLRHGRAVRLGLSALSGLSGLCGLLALLGIALAVPAVRAQAMTPVAGAGVPTVGAAVAAPADPVPDEAAGPRAWRIEPSLRLGATATSNAGIADRRASGRDLILEATPALSLRHQGGGLKLDGELELVALAYLDGTQPNRLLPRGTLRANAEAVEDWLWIEALASVDQTNADPFAARGDGGSALNTIATWRWRLAPVLRRAWSPVSTLEARLGLEATQRRGDYAANDPRRDQRRRDALLRLQTLPRPFGWTLEATDDETRFLNDVTPVLRLSEARAVATWQADPTLVLGAVAGQGRTRFPLASRTDAFAGGRLQWTPQERTALKLSAERRFFGGAYDLEASHRNPFFAAYLNLLRQPSAQPASLLLSGGGDVGALLDAIFTTRFPNPVERAAVVQGVLDGLGRPGPLARPVEVFSEAAQLQRRANLALVWQGRRSTATLRWIALDARELARGDSPFVPTPAFGADNRQRLVSFDLTHRLAADLSVAFSLGRGRIEGLGVIDGAATDERIARLALTWAVHPNLDLSAGLRRQLVSSTVQPSTAEWALIVGALLRH